jgi:aspartate racemase
MPASLRPWIGERTDYPRDRSVVQVFEEVAAAHPRSIALVFERDQLTYAELNLRANRLAQRLLEAGVTPGTMVGCCIERSLELIVALLAVLKAGCAYVPLDPAYPKERLDYLLGDTQAPVMLTQRALAETILSGHSVPLVLVDDDRSSRNTLTTENPQPRSGPESLAYVMYTSGSTGRPKGVMVEHRAIVRLVRNTNFCRFGQDEVFLQFAPISFDASTLEIWGPLLNGGKLVIMPPQASSLEDLGRVIGDHGVTTLWLTAGLFSLMIDERIEDLRPVRQLLAGGDVLSPRHVQLVLDKLADCTLINGYGPTENTTFTCCHVMRHGDRIGESVPIGRPISNTRVYILDDALRPVPAGEIGELYTAGDGLARGYLNNPDATREKFLPDPFVGEPGERMYRTGDLARWTADGLVEFLGRADQQVKILGHRIEPGEIEAALAAHPEVRQSCVVAHGDGSGSKRLVAYYVASTGRGATPGGLKDFLAAKLPQYLVPALFIQLPALPLSPNGKVDRAALPKPAVGSTADAPSTAGATPIGQTIIDLWRRVLKVDRIGLNDNFFDLGGDSLQLVAVHSNLQKTLQIKIPLTDLFEFTTVDSLERHLADRQPAAPALDDMRQQAQRQRAALARQRERRAETGL